MRRQVAVITCALLAMGGWLTAVLCATRDNVRVDIPDIYAQLGSTGVAEDCPDVTVAPTPEAVAAATTLRDLATKQPGLIVPNPDPAFGTLPVGNAITLAGSSLQACIDAAPRAAPGWAAVIGLLR